MEEYHWSLSEVRVRPVRDTREQRRWDRLMAAPHDLSFRCFYGRALRHVAVCGESWLAISKYIADMRKRYPQQMGGGHD